MSQFSPEPDEPPYVTVTMLGSRRSLPEVIEALDVLDRTWTWVARLTAIESSLQATEVAFIRDGEVSATFEQSKRDFQTEIVVEPQEIAALRFQLADYRRGPRPQVSLTMQSPLVVELSGWIAGTSLGGIAVWQGFKYLVANAEDIAGLPHRLRAGWALAQARSDDARLIAKAAQIRRELMELELAEAQSLDELGRSLRSLGRLEIESNVGEDSSLFDN